MSEKVFWSNFYSNNKVIESSSTFSQIISGKDLVKPGSKLLDVGCGNGRDSRYFSNKYQITGIDQVDTVIGQHNKTCGPNETYKSGNFTSKDFLLTLGYFDIIYSRFTLHSVSKKDCSVFLKTSYDMLNADGKLCVEVRSIKSDKYQKGDPDPNGDPDAWILGHYRRFLRIDELELELTEIGYTIDYIEERNGWSVYRSDDPVLIRVIASK